jgi:hypothetical protein
MSLFPRLALRSLPAALVAGAGLLAAHLGPTRPAAAYPLSPIVIANPFTLYTLDGPADGDDHALTSTVDGAGYVIVGGFTQTGGGKLPTVAKYGYGGKVQWLRTLPYVGEIRDVATDSVQNVVAAGVASDGTDDYFVTAKWDRYGNLQWLAGLGWGAANAVTIGPNDRIYAAGRAVSATDAAGKPVQSFVVGSWEANGVPSPGWGTPTNVFPQFLFIPGVDLDGEATSIARDSNGNVVAAGKIRGIDGSQDFAVMSWTPSAQRAWSAPKLLDGDRKSEDRANAVAVDRQNNVIAAGFTTSVAGDRDLTVMKWSAQGTPVWSPARVERGSLSTGVDEANSLALDGMDNIIVGGRLANMGRKGDFTVLKYAPDSSLLWTFSREGGANDQDIAQSVAVDRMGNVAAAGFLTSATTGKDFAVFSLAPADGAVRREHRRDGTMHGADEATSVGIDSFGTVSAVGWVRNNPAFILGTVNQSMDDWAVFF